jgi:hypothetical protein
MIIRFKLLKISNAVEGVDETFFKMFSLVVAG